MAEAFGKACHALVRLYFRSGSGSDYRDRHPELPHLGAQQTKTRKSRHWIFNVGCWG
jgi:hypothetical protein